MLNATPSSVIHRMAVMWMLVLFILLPAALWSQQEGQAALEPMVMTTKSGMYKAISPGRKVTLKGFPDKPFSVRGHLIGVSRDSVYLSMDPRGYDEARVHIEDVGSVSYIRIVWLIIGAILVLYLGGAVIAIALAIASAGSGIALLGLLLILLIFGLPTFFIIRSGFRYFNMTRWQIKRGR